MPKDSEHKDASPPKPSKTSGSFGARSRASAHSGESRASLRRPGGSLTQDGPSRRSVASDPEIGEEDDDDEDDGAIDCSSLRAFCLSICRRCSRRAGTARRAAAEAVKEEAYEAWGKTKTARRLWVLRNKCRCAGRRPSRSSLRNLRRSLSEKAAARKGGGGRRKPRKQDDALKKLKEGSGDGGFGVQCFIIHNPGDLENYFEVEKEELAVGGSARIYKAVERSTHVERAVKMIRKVDATDVGRAVQEVAIMKVLDHPNIAKLFETFQDDDYLYLVMELCSGGDLLDRLLDTGAYNEFQAAVVLRTVLMTLNYMHANGYVHRDIKPENVMFKDARRDVLTSALRLVDFGFARKLPDGKEGKDKVLMTTKVGSPLYVAPEVIEGEYDERCDIWSCGVLCYVLLCGYPPFIGANDADTLHLIRRGEWIFRRKHWQPISKPAKHLVRHLIEPDREKRMPMREALGHPWLKARGVLRVERMRDETVDRLLTFNTYHKLRRAAMLAVAYQLEANDVRELVELFQGLDLNGDGLLTSPEFVKGVQACGIEEAWITRMMASVDADNSGVIDFCEFLAATLDQDMYIKNHAALFRAFRSFDQDDSGGLSREEIAETLKMTGPEDLEEVQEFFKDVDLNGDGVMDYGEFYSLLQREIDPEKTVFKVEDEFLGRRRSSRASARSSRSSHSLGGDEVGRRTSAASARSSARSSRRSSARSGAEASPKSGRRRELSADQELAAITATISALSLGSGDDHTETEDLRSRPSESDIRGTESKLSIGTDSQAQEASDAEDDDASESGGSGSGTRSSSSASEGSGSRSASSAGSRSRREDASEAGSPKGAQSPGHERGARRTVSIMSSEMSEAADELGPGRRTVSFIDSELSPPASPVGRTASKRSVSIAISEES